MLEWQRQGHYRDLNAQNVWLSDWEGGLNDLMSFQERWFLAGPTRAMISYPPGDPAQVVRGLNACQTVRWLDLNGRGGDQLCLSEQLIRGLGSMNHLRTISLEEVKLSDVEFDALLGDHVERVMLSNQKLSPASMAHFARLPALKEIHFHDCFFLRAEPSILGPVVEDSRLAAAIAIATTSPFSGVTTLVTLCINKPLPAPDAVSVISKSRSLRQLSIVQLADDSPADEAALRGIFPANVEIEVKSIPLFPASQ